jgi:predicted Fe-S protein YdhL (DUF1289 family)
MPIVTQVLCDGCHTVKKETNHWYSLTVHEQTVSIGPLRMMTAAGQPCVERGSAQQYFCGQYCVLEALTRWMDFFTTQIATPDHTLTLGDAVLRGPSEQRATHVQDRW